MRRLAFTLALLLLSLATSATCFDNPTQLSAAPDVIQIIGEIEACAIDIDDVEWYQLEEWSRVDSEGTPPQTLQFLRVVEDTHTLKKEHFLNWLDALPIEPRVGSVSPQSKCDLALTWDPTATILDLRFPTCAHMPSNVKLLVNRDNLGSSHAHAAPPKEKSLEMALKEKDSVLPLAHGFFRVSHDGKSVFARSRLCVDHRACNGSRLLFGKDGKGVFWM